jgi:hypothetical protein
MQRFQSIGSQLRPQLPSIPTNPQPSSQPLPIHRPRIEVLLPAKMPPPFLAARQETTVPIKYAVPAAAYAIAMLPIGYAL